MSLKLELMENVLQLPEGEVKSTSGFVIVGANGSGKSRLGAWIEMNQGHRGGKVLRVSAQRVLKIPDVVVTKPEAASWRKLCNGVEDESVGFTKKVYYKWRDGIATVVDDYENVLSAIFARKGVECENYVRACQAAERDGREQPKVPRMISDTIAEIWNSVFSHRRIELADNTVKVVNTSNAVGYHAKEMSDGERVAIYLIGQCLVAPPGSIIIIDEPELHLHKSIMHRLWDGVERFCQDKTLVYITHDLDFASSRNDYTKIWVQGYSGSDTWKYSVLDATEEIPDRLFLEVLGTRKPVLFVEGNQGSHDTQLYPYIYDKYSVIPCSNCASVISLTQAFNRREVRSLHAYKVCGLVDRDYMTAPEIDALQSKGVAVLSVAEVENLYLLEAVIRKVASCLMQDEEQIFNEVREWVCEVFARDLKQQIRNACEREIYHRLKGFSIKKDADVGKLTSVLADFVKDIDVQGIYKHYEEYYDQLSKAKDYDKLLAVYNSKGLHRQVATFFGLQSKEYSEYVLRILKAEGPDGDMACALRAQCPELPDVPGSCV